MEFVGLDSIAETRLVGPSAETASFVASATRVLNVFEQNSTMDLPYVQLLQSANLYNTVMAQATLVQSPNCSAETTKAARETLSLLLALEPLALGQPQLSEVGLRFLHRELAHRWEVAVCLGHMLLLQQRYYEAEEILEQAVHRFPDVPATYRTLGTFYEYSGNLLQAHALWTSQAANEPVRIIKSTSKFPAIRVLVLETPLRGNVAFSHFLKIADFQFIRIFPEHHQDYSKIPEYDVLFNVIGDMDLCETSIEHAERLVALNTKPVLNTPRAVAATARVTNAARLGRLPGVKTATMHEFKRTRLLLDDGAALLKGHGFEYPFLIRNTGFSNGRHFHLVANEYELQDALKSLPRENVVVMSFIATRSPDGAMRKYRVMRIDGVLFPIHLAISHHWKIHYHSAAMLENEEYRIEEQSFLNSIDAVLSPAVINTLHSIFNTLNLDYAGIDFSINADGEVVVFEANATMALATPSSEPRLSYRHPALAQAQLAAAAMVKRFAEVERTESSLL
jgi:tetratricopeptide (TPR) repeat protein